MVVLRTTQGVCGPVLMSKTYLCHCFGMSVCVGKMVKEVMRRGGVDLFGLAY